jgi:serine/threonine protein kinase
MRAPHCPGCGRKLKSIEKTDDACPDCGKIAATDGPRPAYPCLAPARRPDELGRLGHFRILRLLGRGGMSLVFHAEDMVLKRPVALKVLRPALADLPARRRFMREARLMALVEHDHVVPVYHAGAERGTPFLVMPLLRGETLEERVRREEYLPPDEVARIGRETALGLAAIHARGLVHRDIKPTNLWLTGRIGRVKLLDFGLAYAGEDEPATAGSVRVSGTPAYMAPEQARGERVDARSDLFGLGCVLYFACTGRPAFPPAGEPTATLRVVAEGQPERPDWVRPEVPALLADLVMQLLAKDPADRPPSARAVLERLRPQPTRPPGRR